MNVDEQIKISNKAICKLIGTLTLGDAGRGLLSQAILSNLRPFVEAISVKVTGETEYSYQIFKKKAKHYVSARADLKFLSKFHKFLQPTVSHYLPSEEGSERLMLKYYGYLLEIKFFLKSKYNFDVLENIDKFPIKDDPVMTEYYEKISEKIKTSKLNIDKNKYVFYIHNIKSFFVGQEIFYEIVFRLADDKLRKFDRLIAFSKLKIIENYAVRLNISEDYITILNNKMPIQIINGWDVFIRPCEFKNFEKIFNSTEMDYTRTKEYFEIMSFLKETGTNLVEIIEFPNNYYNKFKKRIIEKSNTDRILKLLDKSREFIKNQCRGSNVLRYLLHSLNNRIIRFQYWESNNKKLSNLNLKYKCIPFDDMPFATSPVGHNPRIYDLIECMCIAGREHELFARQITINAETKGWLYTPIKKVQQFSNVPELINTFNDILHEGTKTQVARKLAEYKKHIYITGYEDAVIEIVKKLKNLSTSGIKNYSNSITDWLSVQNSNGVDCSEKRKALMSMFVSSKVSLVYGAAGTGKTRLIEHISKYHNEGSKLYLANTHSSISNLKSRITAQNTKFSTIKSFLHRSDEEQKFDLLIIDECSVVSNLDMQNLLRKVSFEAVILVGDIFQIESIRFGNWFYIARSFISESSVTELVDPWRTKNDSLLELCRKVRELETNIDEHIINNNYASRLDDSIFNSDVENEIILCLNYDGLYGINNINR